MSDRADRSHAVSVTNRLAAGAVAERYVDACGAPEATAAAGDTGPARDAGWLRAARWARALAWISLVWMCIEGAVGLWQGSPQDRFR